MEKETSLIDKKQNVQEDRKPLSVVGKKQINPEEFLLEKEKTLGKLISPRFREFFYRKLKELKDPEKAWSSIHGN
ncbi:hypothetical protein [Leptospira andrefontaineae]|uniref:Uncharacterized protein n=1 Tax=Leptospira andrefontaineae TaxID=2484976 RepID=A0A4R9H6L3_9LEPT|nr:hypothetical protein [Leptospira andrefontaineae]TGK41224.1 hypothetical protein EHO65_07275 [Leptospira andrefontaineae]